MSPAPVLDVTAVDAGRDICSGDLVVCWRLRNLGAEPIAIHETWLPHGRFLAERRLIDPPLDLASGAECLLQRTVRHSAANGEVVENAFLNLRVSIGHDADDIWRLLARMRVVTGATGLVRLTVEAVTWHKEGFAEAAKGLSVESHGST